MTNQARVNALRGAFLYLIPVFIIFITILYSLNFDSNLLRLIPFENLMLGIITFIAGLIWLIDGGFAALPEAGSHSLTKGIVVLGMLFTVLTMAYGVGIMSGFYDVLNEPLNLWKYGYFFVVGFAAILFFGHGWTLIVHNNRFAKLLKAST